MSLNLLDVCLFNGPALPEPFVQFELEKELAKLGLLSKSTGEEGKRLQAAWEIYRRHLRELAARGGPLRVRHCVIDPLVHLLGFESIESSDEVKTREGSEDGGHLLRSADGSARLRIWTTEFDEDLDAPARRGAAYRFSRLRIAQRVLLTTGERIGLLTNGTQARILLSDPARPDSEVVIPIESAWKRSRELPDSFRLLLAICQPKGIQSLADLVEKARLQQVSVTRELRLQARRAVEQFIQELLDDPQNRIRLEEFEDKQALAKDLWHEGLVLVYRLLFILKLETTDDGARSFRFTSSSLWRNTFSPSLALAPRVRDLLDHNEETGNFLEAGLRALFQMFTSGLECSELHVSPLGGALFGPEAAPLLDGLHWGDRAVAYLLDQLLWTDSRAGLQRVHYGSLDVEDLGRVYEALLELEAGLATEALCRLRRQKLEVVVPAAQGERYKIIAPTSDDIDNAADDDIDIEDADDGKKTKVEWIEEVPAHRFYLRVGLGRKASGSYYTPHSFVRFLVQETLGPLAAERSPHDDPNPAAILKLKVLDPAMGSGHFLVEACRFLGDKLYEACRLCDERATPAEIRAENSLDVAIRDAASAEAMKYRGRIVEIPDPNNEITQYLPSRAPEGGESGLSQRKALALCRRLVAVHCLYGVDKNLLAVELAKLALWLESHAEGLPLTFLNHRLVSGDSLIGASLKNLLTYPNSGESIEGLFGHGLKRRLSETMGEALRQCAALEATVGTNLAEVYAKAAAKRRLDLALAPFRRLASEWTARMMSGKGFDSDYLDFARSTLEDTSPMIDFAASDGLPFEFVFPEVFYSGGDSKENRGFDAILGNPPWDTVTTKEKEWFSAFDFEVLQAPNKSARELVQRRILENEDNARRFSEYLDSFERMKRAFDRLYQYQKIIVEGDLAGRFLDLFRVFMERAYFLLRQGGRIGIVVPSAFHANEGATGIRRLYLYKMNMQSCFSFENRRKLFEIDSRQRFDLVVSEAGSRSSEFPCAFYLHDENWLFGDRREQPEIMLSLESIERIDKTYLSFQEFRTQTDAEVAFRCYAVGRPLKEFCREHRIQLTVELNTTKDEWRFERLPNGIDHREPSAHRKVLGDERLLLLEGKHFWQFNDRWADGPRFAVPLNKLTDKPDFLKAAQQYRLGFRDVSSSTNERTSVFSLLCPGVVFAHSVLAPERTPQLRPSSRAIELLTIANSYSFDFLARLRAGTHLSAFILEGLPLPTGPRAFLVHSGLRLQANHEGYQALWDEQLGKAWREASGAFEWPAVRGDESRWRLRALVDALVAHAYGLDLEQYRYILSTFKHEEYARSAELCIAAFEELQRSGLAAYIKDHDPYADIPVVDSLPSPVIHLGRKEVPSASNEFELSAPPPRAGRARKRR